MPEGPVLIRRPEQQVIDEHDVRVQGAKLAALEEKEQAAKAAEIAKAQARFGMPPAIHRQALAAAMHRRGAHHEPTTASKLLRREPSLR